MVKVIVYCKEKGNIGVIVDNSIVDGKANILKDADTKYRDVRLRNGRTGSYRMSDLVLLSVQLDATDLKIPSKKELRKIV